MKNLIFASTLLLSLFFYSKVYSQTIPNQIQVEVLSKSTTSWDGSLIPNYPQD